jgi:hypothetical protein
LNFGTFCGWEISFPRSEGKSDLPHDAKSSQIDPSRWGEKFLRLLPEVGFFADYDSF